MLYGDINPAPLIIVLCGGSHSFKTLEIRSGLMNNSEKTLNLRKIIKFQYFIRSRQTRVNNSYHPAKCLLLHMLGLGFVSCVKPMAKHIDFPVVHSFLFNVANKIRNCQEWKNIEFSSTKERISLFVELWKVFRRKLRKFFPLWKVSGKRRFSIKNFKY